MSTIKDVHFCIDGDLVEMFLEMNEEVKGKIVNEINAEQETQFTIQSITNYLQDIRTKH